MVRGPDNLDRGLDLVRWRARLLRALVLLDDARAQADAISPAHICARLRAQRGHRIWLYSAPICCRSSWDGCAAIRARDRLDGLRLGRLHGLRCAARCTADDHSRPTHRHLRGFSLFAFSCWLFSGITASGASGSCFRHRLSGVCDPALHRALGRNGTERRPAEELRFASGLFNLMRNVGGAIGIATVTSGCRLCRIHGERFGEALTNGNTSELAHAVARISAHTPDAQHARLLLQGNWPNSLRNRR